MFLDTSGLLCLHHRAEPFHREACQAYREAHARLTHGYVLAEFIALAQARRLPRPEVLEFTADLVANADGNASEQSRRFAIGFSPPSCYSQEKSNPRLRLASERGRPI